MILDPIKKMIPENVKPYWLLLKIGLISYALIYFLTRFCLLYIFPEKNILVDPITDERTIRFTLYFLFFSGPVIYIANCLLARKILKMEWGRMLLYCGLAMLFGCTLEILVNSLFTYAFDRPGWLYRIWPKYGGYTSGVTCIMWPLYGLHLYLFHLAMTHLKSPLVVSIPVKGIMLAIDAMIMETIANIFSLSVYNSYYFYYLKGDLKHFTTIEIFLPYVMVGLFIMTVFHLLDRPHIPRALIGILAMIGGWLFLFS